MDKKISTSENGKQLMEIIIGEDEFQVYHKKAYNKLKKDIQLPGFRRGKVPYPMAIKAYGKALEADAMEIASQEEFQKVVEQDKINLISQPSIIDIIRENGAIKFKVEYEIYPSIVLTDYKGITLDEPTHTVTDEEIQEDITKILNAKGDIVESDVIEDENHVITADFVELDSETKEPVEGAESKEDHFYLNNEKIDTNLVDALLTHKTGDTVIYEFEHEGGHDGEDNPDLEGQHSHFYNVTIKQVQKIVPKELNEEFIKEYSDGRFDNEDDFKEEIEFQLQEQWDQKSKELLEQQIVTKLVNDNEFDVPEAFVKNALDQMIGNFQQQFGQAPQFKNADSQALRDEFRPMAVQNVKWELIRNSIVENEGIKVEDYDIEQLANKEAERTGQTPEQLIEVIKNNDQVQSSILAKKAMEFIMDFAITNEVDFEDID
ncbi:trigger factor [Candidatus Kapabacteria bacterium]|nr:trigger factor [Candidatus Kapabacteria bacterium]